MNETVFRNARVVLRDEVVRGTVAVRDGIIHDVSRGDVTSGDSAHSEDLAGDVLMPGLVELHTDQAEQHLQPRPGRFWDPVPALLSHDAQMATSGVTTVFDAIRIGAAPGDDVITANAERLVDAAVSASNAGILRADHVIHLRCEVSTPDVVDVFDTLGSHHLVRMISLMDHTPGERQYADLDAYRAHVVGTRRMSEDAVDEHLATLRALSEAYADGHRTELSRRARERGLTIATHDDETVEHVSQSSALGVTISEFPTTLVAAEAAREAGQFVVMGAPNIVRGGSHTGNVAAATLLDHGLLDILSSDYVPASLLQAVFLIAQSGAAGLPEAAALVTATPARAAGFDDRGLIAPGRRADLVRVQVHEGLGVPVVRGVWREGRRVA